MNEEREARMPDREAPVHSANNDAAHRLDIKTRLVIWLGGVLLDLLGWTWRIEVYGRQELIDRSSSDERVVYVLWHGEILPIAYVHRQRSGVLISQHRDGEIIARVVGRYGFFGIRGSTSRGGARAILACVAALKNGADVVITPDGPRGPRHEFAPGALAVALRAHAAIVPITAHANRKWQLKSWDRFEIPKPFAKVTVLFGTPRRVQGVDVKSVTDEIADFTAHLHHNAERVAALAAAR